MKEGKPLSNEGQLPISRTLDIEEILAKYDNVIPEVDKALAESRISGLQEPPETPNGLDSAVRWGPHGDPFPPEDLTVLDTDTLGQLFSLISGWTNYVSAECTRAKNHLSLLEQKQEILCSALKVHFYKVEKAPATILNDMVKCDTRFVEYDIATKKLSFFHSTAESRHEQLRRSLNNISREQTRRQDENNRENRSTGWRGKTDEAGKPIRPNFRR